MGHQLRQNGTGYQAEQDAMDGETDLKEAWNL